MLYCHYNLLDIFRAIICPLLEARDYTCVFAANGVNALVVGGRLLGADEQVMRSGIHILEKLKKHIKISSK